MYRRSSELVHPVFTLTQHTIRQKLSSHPWIESRYYSRLPTLISRNTVVRICIVYQIMVIDTQRRVFSRFLDWCIPGRIPYLSHQWNSGTIPRPLRYSTTDISVCGYKIHGIRTYSSSMCLIMVTIPLS